MIQIAKDVFQIPLMPRNGINCYLLEDVLIDAGIQSSHNKILHALHDKNVNAHALTHAHADHQGSSRTICETLHIPLWCSALEKPPAESGDVTREYPRQKHVITQFQQRFWQGKGYPVSRILQEGDEVGGFKVVNSPGHSSGHISFFRETDGVLIAGDTMTNMNLLTTFVGLHEPPALFTLNQEQNAQSILKLAALHPSIICFGHGPFLADMKLFKNFVTKVRKRIPGIIYNLNDVA